MNASKSNVSPSGHKSFPRHARVVIIGGGVAGCSVAYHLTKRGWTDVVVLERGQLSSGTTWHSAGDVPLMKPTGLIGLVRYGAELYAQLEKETGQSVGWRNCGYVKVARTKARFEDYKRSVSTFNALGGEADRHHGYIGRADRRVSPHQYVRLLQWRMDRLLRTGGCAGVPLRRFGNHAVRSRASGAGMVQHDPDRGVKGHPRRYRRLHQAGDRGTEEGGADPWRERRRLKVLSYRAESERYRRIEQLRRRRARAACRC